MLRMLLATGGTLVALAPGLGAEPVRRGPAPAPLVWTTSPATAAVPPEGLLEKARAIAGPSAVLGTPSLTQLTDEGWLRTAFEVRAWRVTATDVVVTIATFPRALVPVDESRRVTVTVDMAFDDSGTLLLAATEARVEMVLPAPLARPRPVGEEVRRWFKELRPLEPGDVLRSAAPEILGVLFARGVDPAQAGAIVLRPCVETGLWAKRRGVVEPAACWLAEVYGVRVRPRSEPAYSSGLVAAVCDSRHDALRYAEIERGLVEVDGRR